MILFSLKLALFFLAILCQFALNALFYHLNPFEEDDKSFSPDGFLFGLYSFLIVMVPLFLLGLAFSVSSFYNKLRQSHNAIETKMIYNGIKKQLFIKSIIGYVSFGIISGFLLLYLICFNHVASDGMTRDWVRSSFITLALDLLILEILPPLMFAILGLMFVRCGARKPVLYLVLALEVYRFHRNAIEG